MSNQDQVTVVLKSSLTCVSSDSAVDVIDVAVKIPTIPQIVNGDIEMCEDDKVSLSAVGGQVIVWLQDGIERSQERSIQLNSVSTGEWRVASSDSICGEQLSNTISVLVYKKPKIDITDDISVVSGESVQLSVNASIGTVLWFPQDYIDDATSVTPLFRSSEEGSYPYSITVTNGPCETEQGMTIKVFEPLKVPNAFSPNGDDINDKWLINGLLEFDYVQVAVFNRWGNKIFEQFGSYDSQNAWDGGDYPVGTYYYMIKLGEKIDSSTEEKVLQGAVTLTK